jgi:hypothetical protein
MAWGLSTLGLRALFQEASPMRIKFNESLSGPNGVHMPGDEVDWSDNAEAKRLIDAGIASAITPVKKSKKVETAKQNKAVETATE